MDIMMLRRVAAIVARGIPVEFRAAAYRFGHSLVRPSYRANLARHILKEAEVMGGARPAVGARIVAEAFVGLLGRDRSSYLNQRGWRPTLPCRTPGTFTIVDMLTFWGSRSDQQRPVGRTNAASGGVCFGSRLMTAAASDRSLNH